MCYFVEHNIQRKELEKRFNVKFTEDVRYSPSFFQSAFTKPFMPVITADQKGIAQLYQWGLIPHWSPDYIDAEKIRSSSFNARAETVWGKPVFRKAMQSGRCLITAHGFFEYHTESNQKTPYYIRLKTEEIFAFAGICDHWMNSATGEIFNTFSILTTAANPLMEEIHNTKKRMPVILHKEKELEWIDPVSPKSILMELLKPFPQDLMAAHVVSRKISERNTDGSNPKLIEKVENTIDLRLF